MYHYVRDDTSRPPYGYYYLDLDDFRAQLDYFESEYGFVEKDNFLRFVRDGEPVSDGVVLTFDDGLIDHYEWVLPELLSRDLWGIFYISTGPLQCNEVLDVHRVHSIIGSVGGKQLLDVLEDIITEEMIPDRKINEFRKNTYQKQDSTESISEAKRILNYFISYSYRSDVIDEVEKRFPESQAVVSELYMSEDQISELYNSGMIIGSHTVSHKVLSKLNKPDQMSEIYNSFDYLGKVVDGLSCLTFCYPYGGEHTYNDMTLDLLERYGCEWSFDVRSADVTNAELDAIYTLPRYDSCEFAHGSATFRILRTIVGSFLSRRPIVTADKGNLHLPNRGRIFPLQNHLPKIFTNCH